MFFLPQALLFAKVVAKGFFPFSKNMFEPKMAVEPLQRPGIGPPI
jgi:hypothetical protein